MAIHADEALGSGVIRDMLSVPFVVSDLTATPAQVTRQITLEFDLDYSRQTIAWFLGSVKWVKMDGREVDLLEQRIVT